MVYKFFGKSIVILDVVVIKYLYVESVIFLLVCYFVVGCYYDRFCSCVYEDFRREVGYYFFVDVYVYGGECEYFFEAKCWG